MKPGKERAIQALMSEAMAKSDARGAILTLIPHETGDRPQHETHLAVNEADLQRVPLLLQVASAQVARVIANPNPPKR